MVKSLWTQTVDETSFCIHGTNEYDEQDLRARQIKKQSVNIIFDWRYVQTNAVACTRRSLMT